MNELTINDALEYLYSQHMALTASRPLDGSEYAKCTELLAAETLRVYPGISLETKVIVHNIERKGRDGKHFFSSLMPQPKTISCGFICGGERPDYEWSANMATFAMYDPLTNEYRIWPGWEFSDRSD